MHTRMKDIEFEVFMCIFEQRYSDSMVHGVSYLLVDIVYDTGVCLEREMKQRNKQDT